MEQLGDKPKRRFRVSFCSEVAEPKAAIKCKTCGHRNVAPMIRETFVCQKCKKLNCRQCINGGENSVCVDCRMSEQYPPYELTEEVIGKINKAKEGTVFKRYCMNCELRIEKGIYCNFCRRRSRKSRPLAD